jgi:hypothetical protein
MYNFATRGAGFHAYNSFFPILFGLSIPQWYQQASQITVDKFLCFGTLNGYLFVILCFVDGFTNPNC